jgi:phage-related protein (TIGR01555 family)
LLGQTPGGLNASGDSDTRNYYDMLDGQRQDILRPIFDRLDPILWRDQTGAVPAEAYFEFGPLWQPTAQEKATTAKTKAETTKLYHDMGLIPDDILAVGVANQLIEDGVYPGAEEQLATVRSAASGAGEDPTEDDNLDPAGGDGRV